MVMQVSQMATMLLGQMPHPQTGETTRDLEAARMFIDQLEMLEAKTKGNLNRDEEKLLKQSLTSLRMAFVEAVESVTKETASSGSDASKQPDAKSPTESQSSASAPLSDEESKKKFTKKY